MGTLGDFRIDRVVEWEGPFVRPDELFPGLPAGLVEATTAWAGPVVSNDGLLRLSFHSFLLRTGRHTILVDGCCGNDKERPSRPQGHRRTGGAYLAELARHGVRPEEVDIVMCTHLHWDHVGWNTRLVDGTWVPTFPNARYVMARREYEHWDALHAAGDRSMHAIAFGDSVAPVVRAERAVLVDDGHEIEPGVQVTLWPGHTPGNAVIDLRSKGARGVFSGDVLHSPLQLAAPALSSRACWDEALSREARVRFIERHADTADVVMPAHFLAPSAGRIVRRGEAFGFVPGGG
ncbi:MAG TPA: MBL fold metallo-hydrolase [Burkholderiaceae bacterium]|nr:MBL fold metallo-hydrolase [Burkholderiaceae bacterium]